MDRKLLNRGKLRSKTANLPSGSFIALGTKAGSSSSAPVTNVDSKSGVKREGSSCVSQGSQGGASLRKKARLDGSSDPNASQPPGSLVAPSAAVKREITRDDGWQKLGGEIPSGSVLAALENIGNNSPKQANTVLCSVILKLHDSRSKNPDPVLATCLALASREMRHLFQSRIVVEGFCSLLKRQPSSGKHLVRQNATTAGLVCGVLLSSFRDEGVWSDMFVKVYLDDALGERVWVDRPENRIFVRNVATAFNSVQVPDKYVVGGSGYLASGMVENVAMIPLGAGSSAATPDDDDTSRESLSGEVKLEDGVTVDSQTSVVPRYEESGDLHRSYVLELLNECWTRRIETITAPVLRTMAVCCGYSEVKNATAQRLDNWLQNPKLQKYAAELLMALCVNCSTKSAKDLEILNYLTKLRLKTKPIIQHYGFCLREMFTLHPDTIENVLRQVVHNELSTSRAPHNMMIIGQAFHHNQAVAAKTLASIVMDLLVQTEDFSRSLRTFLREMIRSALRFDFPLVAFCSGLLAQTRPDAIAKADQALLARIHNSIIDVVCLSIFLGITPSIRELQAAISRNEKRDVSLMRSYQRDVAQVFVDTVQWLHDVVPGEYRPSHAEYVRGFYRVLFLDKPELYTGKDSWPTEQDRTFMLRIIAEAPIREEVLMRILLASLTNEMMINRVDAVDLVDSLVKRAAVHVAVNLADGSTNNLQIENLEFFDILFRVVMYNPPKDQLPPDYTPPLLAVTHLYFRAWYMLIVLAAFNPKQIGLQCWNNYPTGRFLMEMAMTKDFVFPPASIVSQGQTAGDIKSRDLQAAEIEKQEILELENFLAGKELTEATSHLLPTVMRMDPKGPARKPSDQFMDFYKMICHEQHLGIRLCKSRDPDFLLEIINRQGATQSLPWLIDLIDSHEGSVEILPVQCLCEFLLHHIEVPETSIADDTKMDIDGAKMKIEDKTIKTTRKLPTSKLKRASELEGRLRTLIWSHDPTDSGRSVEQIVSYFFNRLSADTLFARKTAIEGISSLLSNPPKEIVVPPPGDDVPEFYQSEYPWLYVNLVALPLYRQMKPAISVALRQACLVETCHDVLGAYVYFVGFASIELDDELILDLSKLLLDRYRFAEKMMGGALDRDVDIYGVLLRIYRDYMDKLVQSDSEITWSDDPDRVFVEWDSKRHAVMDIKVILACFLLLLRADGGSQSSAVSLECVDSYASLIDSWFPSSAKDRPSANLVAVCEEADLYPDPVLCLVLKSKNRRIIDAAIEKLTDERLLCFLPTFGLSNLAAEQMLRKLNIRIQSEDFVLPEAFNVDQFATFMMGYSRMGIVLGDAIRQKFEMDKYEKKFKLASSLSANKLLPTEITPMETDVSDVESHESIKAVLSNELFSIPDPNKTATETVNESGTGVECESPRAKWLALMRHLGKEAKTPPGGSRPCTERSLNECLTFMANNKIHSTSKKRIIKARTAHWITVLSVLRKSVDPSESQVVKAFHGVCSAFRTMTPENKPINRLVDSIIPPSQKPPGPEFVDLIEEEEGLLSPDTVEEKSSLDTFIDHCLGNNAPEVSQSLLQDAISSFLAKPIIQAGEKMGRFTKTPAGLKMNDKNELGSNNNYVNWAKYLDPELVMATIESPGKPQMAAIFDKDACVDQRRELFSALPHNVSIDTLRRVLEDLLDGVLNRYDPRKVLDFISACYHLPKLWRGRDRRTPRHSEPEDIFNLTNAQAGCLLDYVIAEVMTSFCSDSGESRDGDELSEESTGYKTDLAPKPCGKCPSGSAQDVIKRRAPLVLTCARNPKVLQFLVEKLNSACILIGSRASRMFLLEIYLKKPKIINWIKNRELLTEVDAFAQAGPCKLDVVCHRLLTELFKACDTDQSDVMLSSVNPLFRKLATLHPGIMIRQLPLVGALLRGIGSMSMRVLLREKNYNVFVSFALDYIELLQPVLFDTIYISTFQDVMKSFLEFVENHGLRNTRYITTIDRCVAVLVNFHRMRGAIASKFLGGYAHLLQALSFRYPCLPNLQSLMANITLPLPPIGGQSSSGASDAPGGSAGSSTAGSSISHDTSGLVPCMSWPKAPPSSEMVAVPLAEIKNPVNVDNLLGNLEKVDNMSQINPEVLQYFAGHLEPLMRFWHGPCREKAFELLMRHFQEDPRVAPKYLTSYLACLDSPDLEIVETALGCLPDYLAVCREKSDILMRKAVLSCANCLGGEGSSTIDRCLRMLHYVVDEGGAPSAAVESAGVA